MQMQHKRPAPAKSKPAALFRLAALCLALLPLFGCAKRVTRSDVDRLQAAVDELRLANYELSERLEALEQAAFAEAAAPAPALPQATPGQPNDATPAGPYAVTADELCSLLLKSGMPVRTFYRYTDASDPDGLLGTESGYTSRADFQDTEVSGALGAVEVFADAAKATLRSTARQNQIKSEKLPAERHYLFDNVLLRLPADAFSEEKAAAYETAVQQVLEG